MSRSRRGKSGRLLNRVNVRKLNIAGWSSLVARRAHNPKVVGSNPAPATTKRSEEIQDAFLFCISLKTPPSPYAASRRNRQRRQNREKGGGLSAGAAIEGNMFAGQGKAWYSKGDKADRTAVGGRPVKIPRQLCRKRRI